MLVKYKKTTFFSSYTLLLLLVFFSSSYRYLRNIPSLEFINYIPYAIGILIAFLVIFKLLLYPYIFYIDLVAIVSFIFFSTFISSVYFFISFGWELSLFFILQYWLPWFVFYLIYLFIGKQMLLKDWFGSVDRLFSIIFYFLVIFFIVEFVLLNFMHVNAKILYHFWDSIGNIGYHQSDARLPFIGRVDRPWGIMMMPQATGGLLSVFAVYYFVVNIKIRSFTAFCLAVLSGSATALFVLVLGSLIHTLLIGKARSIIYSMIILLVGSAFILQLWVLPRLSYSEYFAVYFNSYINTDILSLDMLRFIVGQGLDYPIIGGGEIRILNSVLRMGLLSGLIGFICVFYLIFVHYSNRKAIFNQEFHGYLLMALLLILASGHYDLVFRYPGSIIFVISLASMALILKERKGEKTRSYSQTWERECLSENCTLRSS